MKDPAWAEYSRYNVVRQKVNGVKVMEAVDRYRLEQIGWTNSEFFIFRTWYFFDPDVFSRKKLSDLGSLVESKKNINSYLKNIHIFIEKRLKHLALLIVLILPLIFYHHYGSILFAISLFELFSLSWYDSIIRMPNHVFFPMMFLIFLNYVCCIDKKWFSFNTHQSF